MANESAWRDRFLLRCREAAIEQQAQFTWLVLNVVHQRGVPDTWVHYHKNGVRGCALIEFKKGKGTIRKAQKVRIAGLRAQGVHAFVVRLVNQDSARIHYIEDGGDGLTFRVVDHTSLGSWNKTIVYIFEILKGL